MNQILGNNIMTLRKDSGLTQEQLANALGISYQAVSKWETGNACPDISMLPLLADLFSVTVDQLIGRVPLMAPPETETEEQPPRGEAAGTCEELPWPDDDCFYAVLYHGRRLIGNMQGDPRLEKAKRHFTFQFEGNAQDIHSDFSVSVDGEIMGSVFAGAGVDCGDVGGNVTAGGGVDCGSVGGSVEAGGSVDCGSVGGNVSAGGDVDCGSVKGGVFAGNAVDSSAGSARAGSGFCFFTPSSSKEEPFDQELEDAIEENAQKAADFGNSLSRMISDSIQKAFRSKGFFVDLNNADRNKDE